MKPTLSICKKCPHMFCDAEEPDDDEPLFCEIMEADFAELGADLCLLAEHNIHPGRITDEFAIPLKCPYQLEHVMENGK